MTLPKFFLIVSFFSIQQTISQGLFEGDNNYTLQDSLRGSITKERAWWDLNFYHLNIKVDPEKKFIKGYNEIRYKVINSDSIMQIDLQPPLKITRITQNGDSLKYNNVGNAYYVKLKINQLPNKINSVKVYYQGNPKEAIRAPWDGGLSWKKDKNGKHFVATSCQGIGASIWWPNKDHMYDEVDSMKISVNVPKGLTNVSNGRLIEIEELTESTTFHWKVVNPINNYGVNFNIGDYINFSEKYDGEKGELDIEYYVLKDNFSIAKNHFKDNVRMIRAFEHWFGPYPFYEDSYKLVEVPYLGMEHQSSITYGNKYMKGYLGKDLSNTGWGLKFDYIIIHEGAHEWFANNITYKDAADMWIHEGFASYAENIFLDFYYGKKASSDYVIGLRKRIKNKKKIIGDYNVNSEGSSDMYSKGSNLLHTIRQIANNDDLWRKTLRGLNKNFYHKTVTTEEVENYISNSIGFNLKFVFDQYLRNTEIPVFEYSYNMGRLKYRWKNVIDGFDMPIKIFSDGKELMLSPTKKWKLKEVQSNTIEVDKNYYVDIVLVN